MNIHEKYHNNDRYIGYIGYSKLYISYSEKFKNMIKIDIIYQEYKVHLTFDLRSKLATKCHKEIM